MRNAAIRFLAGNSFWVFELFTSLLALGWGFVFAFIDRVSYTSAFRVLDQAVAGKEFVWGMFFLALGSCQLASVLSNNHHWRETVSFFAGVAWTFVALALFGATGFSTGVYCYGLVALFNGLASLRQRLAQKAGL
jgi:hypothetical protein